jgi:hypothetical protein
MEAARIFKPSEACEDSCVFTHVHTCESLGCEVHVCMQVWGVCCVMCAALGVPVVVGCRQRQ